MKTVSTKEVSEAFQNVPSLCKAKTLLKDAGILHASYSFYTTLNRVKGILCDRRMWLTRLDSEKFDDTIEHKKYGLKKEQELTFVRCLSFAGQESAAMWGLYCPPTYQAIRVTFSKEAIRQLSKQKAHRVESGVVATDNLDVMRRTVSDIFYASVKGEGDTNERSNSLYWNGVYTKNRIDEMNDTKDRKTITGFVKDSEWKFEYETRLLVKTRHVIDSEHIAIEVPDEAINSMSFTLSPWMDGDESAFVVTMLTRWLKTAGRQVSSEDEKVFHKSSLTGGLGRWKERHGL